MNARNSFLIFGFIAAASIAAVAAPPAGTVLWVFDEGATITCSPALAFDGTVYVGTLSSLCAVTNSGGVASNRWVVAVAVGSSSPAIAVDGAVYVCSNDGYLHAINPDGSERWSYQAQCGGSSPGIGADGTIYVEGTSSLYAVTPAGGLKWRAAVAVDSNFSSPVIGGDGTVYLTSANIDSLYAFTPAGSQKWVQGGTSKTSDSPAVDAGGGTYVAAGPLFAFASDGTQVWSTYGFFDGASPVIGTGRTTYARNFDDHMLYAIDQGGQTIWKAAQEPARYAPPTTPAVDSHGNLYYCASNSLIALDSAGQVLWSVYGGNPPLPGAWLAGTSPAIGADGTIYAALGTKLYAIAGTNTLSDTPWPMYRQNPRHTGRVERPSLNRPQKRSDANFQFQLYPQQLGLEYTIQTSSNLNTWSSLTSFVANAFPSEVVDLGATNHPTRFYRALSPPQ